MAWREAVIPNYLDAHAASNALFDQSFRATMALARAGRLAEAEGAIVWSKMDLRTGATTFLFNDTASVVLRAFADAIGAVDVEPRQVTIGIRGYGRLWAYSGPQEYETVDLYGQAERE